MFNEGTSKLITKIFWIIIAVVVGGAALVGWLVASAVK